MIGPNAAMDVSVLTREITCALDQRDRTLAPRSMNLYSKPGANRRNLWNQRRGEGGDRQPSAPKLFAGTETCCRIARKSTWDWAVQLMLHDATRFKKEFCSETPYPKKVVSHNLAQHELI
jgi:hypothetical protein